jgi:hypothetical protein
VRLTCTSAYKACQTRRHAVSATFRLVIVLSFPRQTNTRVCSLPLAAASALPCCGSDCSGTPARLRWLNAGERQLKHKESQGRGHSNTDGSDGGHGSRCNGRGAINTRIDARSSALSSEATDLICALWLSSARLRQRRQRQLQVRRVTEPPQEHCWRLQRLRRSQQT